MGDVDVEYGSHGATFADDGRDPKRLYQNASCCGGSGGNAIASSSACNNGASVDFDFEVFSDMPGSYILHVTNMCGFVIAPEQVSQGHVAGSGHFHAYAHGVKLTRFYSTWFQLPKQFINGSHI